MLTETEVSSRGSGGGGAALASIVFSKPRSSACFFWLGPIYCYDSSLELNPYHAQIASLLGTYDHVDAYGFDGGRLGGYGHCAANRP